MEANVIKLNTDSMPQNVNDLDIPQELYERLSCGTEWVDALMTPEGGFIPSYVYLFSGMSGAGKSSLLRQIANGFTQNDAIVLYNSSEEDKFQVAINVRKYGLESGFLISNEHDVTELLKMASRLRAMNPGKKVILIHDSIQTMENRSLEALEAITAWAKKTKCLTLVVSQVTKKGTFSGSNKILHLVDAMIELMISGVRTLNVSKNRGGQVTIEPIEYEFTPKGIQAVSPPQRSEKGEKGQTSDEDETEIRVGCRVKCVYKCKHKGRKGMVRKVGRTRVTVEPDDGGDELYVPFDWLKLI